MTEQEGRNSVKHTQQKNRRVRSRILLVVILLLVGVLGFSLYQFLSVYIPQQKEQQHFAELRELISEDVYEYVYEDPDPDDTGATPDSPDEKKEPKKVLKKSKYEELFKRYGDMCGWLRIDDTPVDYPVMKSDREEGEYYLHRDVDGDYSFAGCLFCGVNCDPSSDIFIVYGHNMNNGSMFGCLTDYGSESFVRSHRDIHFDTKDERRVYRVFAAFQATAYSKDDKVYKYYDHVGTMDEDAYRTAVDYYRSLAYVWTGDPPAYPTQILLLSTCYTDKERFVVAAYRIE